MSLPNVPRNVIAHELGHAIGLPHNSDPALLMCDVRHLAAQACLLHQLRIIFRSAEGRRSSCSRCTRRTGKVNKAGQWLAE
jgi:predicted Zn-dependent protease